VGHQQGRGRQAAVGVPHRLDVIVECAHERLGVDRVEPQRLTIEEQKDDVGEGAGTEAAADGEVYDIAEPSPLPLVVVDLGRHRREPVVGAAATAASRADEELTARPRHVDAAAVGADDEITAAHRGPQGFTGG